MHNHWFSIRNLLALLLTGAFVLTAVPALILSDVQGAAFSASTYERALTDAGFYRQFPGLLAGVVQENIGGNTPAFLQRITADQWQAVVSMLLPEQQLKSMTDDVLSQVFSFANGNNKDPRISLSPLKQSLTGAGGVDAALYILHSQPDCTAEQIAAMLRTLGGELCNPPQQIIEVLRPLLQAEVQTVAAALPDDVSLTGITPGLQPMVRDVQLARLGMRISPLVPLVILLILTVVAVRSVKDWLRWWGWSLLLTGLVSIPASLISGPVLAWSFSAILQRNLSADLTPALASSIRSIVEATLREILQPAARQGLLLGIGGALLVVAALLIRRRPSDDLADTRPTRRVS